MDLDNETSKEFLERHPEIARHMAVENLLFEVKREMQRIYGVSGFSIGGQLHLLEASLSAVLAEEHREKRILSYFMEVDKVALIINVRVQPALSAEWIEASFHVE